MKIYEEIKNSMNYYGYDDTYFTYEFYKAYIAYIQYRNILWDSNITLYDKMIEKPIKEFNFYNKTYKSYEFFLKQLYKYSFSELIHSI